MVTAANSAVVKFKILIDVVNSFFAFGSLTS